VLEHAFLSSEVCAGVAPLPCSCFFVGLWLQPAPNDGEPQNLHLVELMIWPALLLG
jgi:hypothetical protein